MRSAGRIFRGTVLGVTDGTVQVGGGQLATVVYRLRVDEAFKGSFEQIRANRSRRCRWSNRSSAPSAGAPALRRSTISRASNKVTTI